MKIKIFGVSNEGKSCVAAFIASTLQAQGLVVHITDGSPEPKDANVMMHTTAFRDQCLRAVASRHADKQKAIDIETVQVASEPHSNDPTDPIPELDEVDTMIATSPDTALNDLVHGLQYTARIQAMEDCGKPVTPNMRQAADYLRKKTAAYMLRFREMLRRAQA